MVLEFRILWFSNFNGFKKFSKPLTKHPKSGELPSKLKLEIEEMQLAVTQLRQELEIAKALRIERDAAFLRLDFATIKRYFMIASIVAYCYYLLYVVSGGWLIWRIVVDPEQIQSERTTKR